MKFKVILTLLLPVPRWEVDNTDLLSNSNISKIVRANIAFASTLFKEYRNDLIKRPAFFKRPPRIGVQVISSMFNKRPALIKRPPRLSTHPIKWGA